MAKKKKNKNISKKNIAWTMLIAMVLSVFTLIISVLAS